MEVPQEVSMSTLDFSHDTSCAHLNSPCHEISEKINTIAHHAYVMSNGIYILILTQHPVWTAHLLHHPTYEYECAND